MPLALAAMGARPLSATPVATGTWAAVPIALWVRLPGPSASWPGGPGQHRRWTLPVASMLALPALWFGSLSMLLALIAVRRMWELADQPPIVHTWGLIGISGRNPR